MPMIRTYPDDLAEEASELLADYGALAHGLGYMLVVDGVTLPSAYHHWATVPDIPAAELGGWEMTLIAIDGAAHLAMGRHFDDHRFYATTYADCHLAIVAPTSAAPIELVTVSD
jgi:hypothetical protein